MSEHCGYVVEVINLRPHSNADKLKIATFFGNDTCVDLSVTKGDKGIYFPSDLQLSEEFCEQNNLVRKKDENGNNVGGYMDPNKRNVASIKLRGEKSDGIFLPLSSVEYTGIDLNNLKVGDTITILNQHEICKKYIPNQGKIKKENQKTNKIRKKKIDIAPLFCEHADTEQLAYNMKDFKAGDIVEITLKMHGTSQRTGFLPVFKGYKRTWLDKIFRREGTPIYNWGYVTGTRRTVLNDFDGGFYGSNSFREPHAKFFEGKLRKGEEVFYEVVGFTDTGTPIMGDCDNKKLNDKEFIKQYGKTTTFSYGCYPSKTEGEEDKKTSDFYVYRMTMTNEDGDVVEYPPDFMRYRCKQMGAKYVPVLWVGQLQKDPWPAGEWIKHIAEQYYDGPDPIGKTHVREGVVCRIVNRPTFTAYKHKNFSFKCLEGIVKAEASQPDMEEMEDLLVNN